MLPPHGAQQGGSGFIVEGDDDGRWRKVRVIVEACASAKEDRR